MDRLYDWEFLHTSHFSAFEVCNVSCAFCDDDDVYGGDGDDDADAGNSILRDFYWVSFHKIDSSHRPSQAERLQVRFYT